MSDGIHALPLVLHTSNHVEPLCQWGRSKAETRIDGVLSFILRASKLEYRSRGARSIGFAPTFRTPDAIHIFRRVAEGTLRVTWTIGYLNHYQRHADKKEHPAQCGLEEAQAVELAMDCVREISQTRVCGILLAELQDLHTTRARARRRDWPRRFVIFVSVSDLPGRSQTVERPDLDWELAYSIISGVPLANGRPGRRLSEAVVACLQCTDVSAHVGFPVASVEAGTYPEGHGKACAMPRGLRPIRLEEIICKALLSLRPIPIFGGRHLPGTLHSVPIIGGRHFCGSALILQAIRHNNEYWSAMLSSPRPDL
ncbi:hypothetical protein IEO21_04675 [Rhodonia placenta]|uniref:Uncharacterized protein n=1 Tax=Rhodonia placenta TaxID=104341 RepID=A0A8H7P3T0_9APHY|nr:hypothetical protein IEO21_04675 [Postia placenta]